MTPFRLADTVASRESSTSAREYLPVSTPPPSGDHGKANPEAQRDGRQAAHVHGPFHKAVFNL